MRFFRRDFGARVAMKPDRVPHVALPKCRDCDSNEFGFEKVAGYRLYGLDGVDKVASGEWIEADDDETAIEVAKEKMNGSPCELWQGRRLVARIETRGQR
jgi:hypothetical protein